MANKYDRVELDIENIWKKQSIVFDPRVKSKNGQSLSFYRKYFYYPLRYKIFRRLRRKGLYEKLIRANLLTGWFKTFKEYWVYELGNRPIELHDFYFLMCNYRTNFQDITYQDNSTHLQAWQQSEVIYFLFHNYYSNLFTDFSKYLTYIKKGSNILEYGCGIAPITHFYSHFLPHYNLSFTIADIKTVHFHFAGWRFSKHPFIKPFLINPEIDNELSGNYDIIFCVQVLEHLPRPLSVVKHLYNLLNENGIFVFDFIKSEGKGLDTLSAVKQRDATLDFIESHFLVLSGSLNNRNNIGRPICKKRGK